MGVAAAEFFSANNAEKQTLLRRISPSDKQMEEQRERWDALSDHLLSDLAKRSGYPMRHWLQGSYKFGTQVRPPRKGSEFDIDLGVYFEWEGSPSGGKYGPAALKGMVQASLEDYSNKNRSEVIEVTPPKQRCCRIRFKGDFHIDVPTYHIDSDQDARSLATQADEWEDSDPKAFFKWFLNTFEEGVRAKARRHIKYMKAWVGLKFDDSARPASVLLTVLVAEAVDELEPEDLATDDEGFNAVIGMIISRLEKDRVVSNPADPTEDLGSRLDTDHFDAFVEKLNELKQTAERACDAKDLVTAADLWAGAFEHFFPAPDEEELAKSIAESSRALAVVQFDPLIQVTALGRKNHNISQRGTNKIGPIPKGCDIEFLLANSSQLPVGSTVSWMVRNEGEEAEEENDLGHKGGVGIRKLEESAYVGRHFMDCIVKRGDQVIGFRRVPVIVQGVPVPPRNPPKPKKTWLRS